jgi:hypothetical protein
VGALAEGADAACANGPYALLLHARLLHPLAALAAGDAAGTHFPGGGFMSTKLHHRARARRWLVGAIIVATAGAACDQPQRQLPTAPAAPVQFAQVPQVTGSKFPRPSEARYVSIGRDAPTFGGLYLTPGHTLVVWGTDSARFGAVSSAVQQHVAADRLGLPPWYQLGAVEMRIGQYTFQQLSDWRDSVSAELLAKVHGVYLSGIDQRHNRIEIGIDREEESSAEDQVRSRLPSLGIPDSAVTFTIGSTPSPQTTYLTDDASSLAGGYELRRYSSDTTYFCTLGVVLDWESTRYVSTASHCGSHFFELDTTDTWYQDSSRVIGYEAWDPASTGTYDGQPSRASDVELIKVNSTSSDRGAIAHTTYRDSATSGSLEIDTSHPSISIYATSSSPVDGLEVDKVGRTTGWTYGTITGTCDDVAYTNGMSVTCEIATSVYTGEGDSGSPLFEWDGEDGADLYGMALSGGNGTTSYFTSYAGFLTDLGGSSGLTITPGTSIGTVSITGSVSGSNPVPSWTAPTITNGNSGDTRHYLYRTTYNGNGTYTDQDYAVASYYDATEYLDLDRTVSTYDGTSSPGIHTAWVSYQVVAYNAGVTKSSVTIYFPISP